MGIKTSQNGLKSILEENDKMSRTYRLLKYINGKPVYTRNENKDSRYRWYCHEKKYLRKTMWRAYRHKCKVYLEKFGYLPKWRNTHGWETW